MQRVATSDRLVCILPDLVMDIEIPSYDKLIADVDEDLKICNSCAYSFGQYTETASISRCPGWLELRQLIPSAL